VRRSVETLRGSMSLASEAGRSTSIELRVPLTLALIDGFAVETAGETYVLPLDTVEECGSIDGGAQATHLLDLIELRGAALPFLRLRSVFGQEDGANERQSLVVVRHEGNRVGLIVDSLQETAQVVVKPLGRSVDPRGLFSGSTILGSGRVGLILDVPALMRHATASARAHESLTSTGGARTSNDKQGPC
jgi:two-component system chemotaxis sensor kinase CheA